jgi:segregation and condensation protein B
MDELTRRIEALLFASGKGLRVKTICEYTDESEKTILKSLKSLQEHYNDLDSSLVITDREDVWKLTVRGKYTKDIEHIASETELPPALLKTLAVIAYKSPVMQADIVNMRGQQSYDHIKQLAKQKFITKEESGRTYLLKITDKFYNYFDVEGDEEIREIFENLRKMQPKDHLGDLEVVDATPQGEATQKAKPKEETVGNLEVVDVVPVRKQEDKALERKFLESMDQRIEELSGRVNEHELPKVQERETPEKEQKELSSVFDEKEDEDDEDYL